MEGEQSGPIAVEITADFAVQGGAATVQATARLSKRTLITHGGKIVLRGGKISENLLCCCEDQDPCFCYQPANNPTPTVCQCLDQDFGDLNTMPSLGVHVSGVTTYQGFGDHVCPTVDQLFMVNCGQTQVWFWHQFSGTTTIGGVLHYQYDSLRATISYNSTPSFGPGILDFEMRSLFFNWLTVLPEDEWTQSGPALGTLNIENNAQDSWKRTSYVRNVSEFRIYRWVYVLGGFCREECNITSEWYYCQSPINFVESRHSAGLPANYYSEPGAPAGGRCRVTDLTFAPYSPTNP
jgi:hypothetical protein